MAYRFTLQHYRTSADRYTCPRCGQKQAFVRYIDTEGKITFPDYVGRCNREDKCGYHYPPRQYFKDNPMENTRSNIRPAIPQPPLPPAYYFPQEVVDKSLKCYSQNNFYRFLSRQIGPVEALETMALYNVGTSRHWPGATVFWQQDAEGRYRTGKVMLYQADGHRSHLAGQQATWAHILMKIDKASIRQCFFGEHLLSRFKEKPVAIVESEKTAVVASHFIPEYVWLATGGKDGMFAHADYSTLQGRRAFLFPDLGQSENWTKKCHTLLSYGVWATCADFLEQEATDSEKAEGLDLADYLLQKISPERQMLNSMIDENPSVNSLIINLGLRLIEQTSN